MEQKRLSLYTVDMKLIRNYHNQGDDRVFSVSPQIGKKTRPFVGIVVICNEKQYCIPLSSPKAKHKSMKNDVDFHRVLDSKGKLRETQNCIRNFRARTDPSREPCLLHPLHRPSQYGSLPRKVCQAELCIRLFVPEWYYLA